MRCFTPVSPPSHTHCSDSVLAILKYCFCFSFFIYTHHQTHHFNCSDWMSWCFHDLVSTSVLCSTVQIPIMQSWHRSSLKLLMSRAQLQRYMLFGCLRNISLFENRNLEFSLRWLPVTDQWSNGRQKEKKEEAVFLFLKQIINSYWSLLTNWSRTSSFSGFKTARGELRSDWSEWIIAKCLFHLKHRHVCIAARDFCLIWSSHTASQHFFVIVMYRRS